MKRLMFYKHMILLVLFLPSVALADLPAVNPTVRYISLGDSLAAGYKAQPATKGFVYRLYLDQVFGSIPETVFANAAVPGATSDDVLQHQLPQVQRFHPTVVTLAVGGNDLLTLLGTTPPTPEQVADVLKKFGANFTGILIGLCGQLPDGGGIFVNDLYEIPSIPGTTQVVPLFNGALDTVVEQVKKVPACQNKNIGVAEVHEAFQSRHGLLLIERYEQEGLENTFEIHPTNKGYRVMEEAYRAVIGR